MITKDNYIEYIVDYYDGNLSPEEEKILLAFLHENPEFYEEFLDYGSSIQTKININIPSYDKTELLKSEFDEFEKLCIGYLEGQVAEARIKKEIKNDITKQATLNLYLKTRLNSNNITYPYKKALLKKDYKSVIYYAAAILIIIISLPLLLKTSSKSYEYSPRNNYYFSSITKEISTKTAKKNKFMVTQQTIKKHSDNKNKLLAISSPKTTMDSILLQKIKPLRTKNLRTIRIKAPETLLAKREVKLKLNNFRLTEQNLKNFDFIGNNFFRKNKIKIKIKDNRLSYLAFNTKNFYVKIY
jgi:hypothetical protein